MPQISIIVPVYKVEKYINRCVDSILTQTFTDFELILVDDGSPDNCPAVCDKYANQDNRVKVIHKKNGGVSSARNSALDIAQGEYITFCDGDDYYLEDWLLELYSAAKKNSTDITMGNFIEVTENGTEISRSHKKTGKWTVESKSEKNRFFINNILFKGNGWAIWSALFRRTVIDRYHIRFCESCENYAEDLAFMLDCTLYASRVCYINAVGYCYVQHPGSMMANSKNTIKFNALNEVSVFFGKHYLKKYSLRSDIYFYSIIHFFIMYTEYKRLVYGFAGSNYMLLPDEMKKISNYDWYKRNSRRLIRAFGKMKNILADKMDPDLRMIAHYSIHRQPFLFKLESALYYKFLVKN